MKWISVKERVPDFNIWVLCSHKGKIFSAKRITKYNERYGSYMWVFYYPMCCEDQDKQSCYECEFEYDSHNTYWMPLPELPKDTL